MGSLNPMKRGDLSKPKHAIANRSQTVSSMLPPGNELGGCATQRFRLLPNYFAPGYVYYSTSSLVPTHAVAPGNCNVATPLVKNQMPHRLPV